MIDPVDAHRTGGQAARLPQTTAGGDSARKFSSTLAAFMSRTSSTKADFAAGEDGETPDPEPIKAAAPVISSAVAKT